jgi:hypothetical protein
MEPSLRSSSYRPTECKLKRTDPALHETIQRFVESLDMRISQYADINYAAKKFQGKRWYWLSQIGRSGYLVFLPKTPIVWIDEQFKQSYKIQMRVSSTMYEKPSVLIASLNLGDGLLRLEDAWFLSGKNLVNNPFTQRWDNLLETYSLLYKHDSALQQGLRIEPAVYEPLESIKNIQKMPNVLIAQGEDDARRLRVQLVQPQTQVPQTQTQVSKPAPRPPPRPEPQVSKPGPRPVQSEAFAIPHPEYPDTYELVIDGVKKGFAAVQDLDLSKRLKLCGDKIRVKIEWNAEFSMYEINDTY